MSMALKPHPFMPGHGFAITHSTAAVSSPAITSVFGEWRITERGTKDCFKTKEWVDMFSILNRESSYMDVHVCENALELNT